jgi:hypothetical protein
MSLGTPSSPVRSFPQEPSSANGLVGLPIGLGAISGIITGRTSRSNWFTVSSPYVGVHADNHRACRLLPEIHLDRSLVP